MQICVKIPKEELINVIRSYVTKEIMLTGSEKFDFSSLDLNDVQVNIIQRHEEQKTDIVKGEPVEDTPPFAVNENKVSAVEEEKVEENKETKKPNNLFSGLANFNS